MAIGKRITDLDQTTTVSNGSNYMVETAAGTMRIRHDDLSKEVAKSANFGNLEELNTENKDSLVEAVNEVYKKSETSFIGTDGVKDGKTGVVPAPSKEDKGKVLGSDGRWVSPSGGSVDATDVKFIDEKNAEEKVGNIDGITDDLNSENSRIAASSVAVKNLNDMLGGFRFYNNPMVVYITDGLTPYTDESGDYVLSDSETGQELLGDSETYISMEMEGDFRSVGGADTVSPFSRSGLISYKVVTNPSSSFSFYTLRGEEELSKCMGYIDAKRDNMVVTEHFKIGYGIYNLYQIDITAYKDIMVNNVPLKAGGYIQWSRGAANTYVITLK